MAERRSADSFERIVNLSRNAVFPGQDGGVRALVGRDWRFRARRAVFVCLWARDWRFWARTMALVRLRAQDWHFRARTVALVRLRARDRRFRAREKVSEPYGFGFKAGGDGAGILRLHKGNGKPLLPEVLERSSDVIYLLIDN